MIDQALAPSRPTFPGVDPGRVAALAVTLLLHVVLVAAFLRPPKQVDAVHEDTVISVNFIDRPRQKAVPPKPRGVIRPSHSATAVSKTASTVRPAPEADVPTPAPAQDLLGRPASTLGLSIKEPDFTFSPPDPLKRPGERWEASVPRMQLRMVDSSLVGRLQAMQKRRICGELGAALTSKSGSTAAILASMANYGCTI